MRILHINSYYEDAPFFKNLYDRQKENGIDISVYVPHKKTGVEEKNLGEYTYRDAAFNEYDRVLFYKKHGKILRNIKEKYDFSKFDILHAHSLFSNGYIAYRLKKEFGIPYIVAVRNTDINVFFKRLIYLRNLGIKIINDAEKVVFISLPYKNEVINKYLDRNTLDFVDNKFIVIPNGIDDFWLNNIYVENRLREKNKIKILCVSSIDKNKNHFTTLKACEEMIKCGYNVEYGIAGAINDKRIFHHLNENKFVKYWGSLGKEELLTLYRKYDFFVMPSITETFGLVYAEAMSQGLPVIYTKGQGFDQQFEEGSVGYHVNAKDYCDIIEKIETINESYADFSYRCKKNVFKFGWETIEEEYRKVYNTVIQK